MTSDEYWQVHVKRNPRLADPEHEIKIKAGSLRRWLEDAYGKGNEHDPLDSLLGLLLTFYRYGPTTKDFQC